MVARVDYNSNAAPLQKCAFEEDYAKLMADFTDLPKTVKVRKINDMAKRAKVRHRTAANSTNSGAPLAHPRHARAQEEVRLLQVAQGRREGDREGEDGSHLRGGATVSARAWRTG